MKPKVYPENKSSKSFQSQIGRELYLVSKLLKGFLAPQGALEINVPAIFKLAQWV